MSQSRLGLSLEKEGLELQDVCSIRQSGEREERHRRRKSLVSRSIRPTPTFRKAQREYDLNKAAELNMAAAPAQKQLEEEEKIAAAKKREDSLLRDRVTDEEIARIGPLDRHPGGETGVVSCSCRPGSMCCTSGSSVRTRLTKVSEAILQQRR